MMGHGSVSGKHDANWNYEFNRDHVVVVERCDAS